jgi:hypothetical protein
VQFLLSRFREELDFFEGNPDVQVKNVKSAMERVDEALFLKPELLNAP